ncbi:MAG: hypothetical protein V7756_01550 [Halopseudomonas sp.]|uniref:S53 family peptidase n=1 Tax=Halopseudomonas sp. TaxID=2901191 RepID=UPI003002A05D
MNQSTAWLRRGVCVAVCLAAAGLYGCKTDNADQEDPAEEEVEHVPAEDDFHPAFVLATDDAPVLTSSFRQSMSVQTTASTTSSSGWTPQQFQQAYNVPASIGNQPAGYGVKVAIITAYHYSNLQYDLNTWAKTFNQKPITLKIINQAGNLKNSNWAVLSSLAVQMVNAVSPGATVYVIEAKSFSQNDIKAAMQTAANTGVNVILMPFGSVEFSTEGAQTNLFANSRIAWIAAAGSQSLPNFPATSPDVIAVGGTTPGLVDPLVETAWADAAAGMSAYERMPSFQMIPSVQQVNTTAYRSAPDVAFNADPAYGARIYVSVLGGWYVIGGTAVSSSFFTGVVAIANQLRKSQNKPMLSSVHTSSGSLQSGLYGLMSSNGGPTNSTVLNDVVDGYAGEGSYPAEPGYDIATGLGSLDVAAFVNYMGSKP